jgi:hypothetical protein
VQNGTPTDLFKITDDGVARFSSTIILPRDCSLNTSGSSATDNRLFIYGGTGGAVGSVSLINLTTNTDITSISGNPVLVSISRAFIPTSGTATYTNLTISSTINQTGGANGITRGLYVNPTLTAAADWRSIEWSNNTGWGLYGAGTANNYLGGNTAIGTSTVQSAVLTIGGSGTQERGISVNKTFTGGTSRFGILQYNTVNSDVTSTAINCYSQFATQEAAFTLTNARHYSVADIALGAGSSVTNQVGFYCGSISLATNNYAFQGTITAGTGRWNLYMSGKAANYLAGDTAIGTTTTSGGRLTVRGSGTTSSTTALLVQNSTPTDLFKILDDGAISIGTLGGTIGAADTSNAFSVTGSNLNIYYGSATQSGYGIRFRSANATNRTNTSGAAGSVWLSEGFAPTSGTGTYTALLYNGTINQTGGANGITRGLYVNPTLTAAADWRSIEWSNNTGWGLYGAGTANNYLAGSLGIGETTLTGFNLRVNKNISGSVTSIGISSTGNIQSGVTIARYNQSIISNSATSTTTTAIAYFAGQGTISGTITNAYGFFVESSLIGATNDYGFYGDIAAATGRWNLYMAGTAANYLAGDTAIGTNTTSGGRLTVRGSTTTSAANSLLVEDSAGTDLFVVRNDGGYAFKGGTVGVAQTGYTTFTNLTTDRTCDANATTVDELADILGTLIEDLKIKGIISA